MDSISQLALGATIGELVLGRHIGRRALLLGAVLGTLPDLDVLVRYSDAVEAFTRHRSWSHSLPVLLLASLPVSLMAHRWFVPGIEREVREEVTRRRWFAAVALILLTHPLLDAFTTYGTQLFWPFDLPPVAIGSVFIIDPLYTIPLLTGIIWSWRRRTDIARRACKLGILLSTMYLGLTLVSQAHARHVAESALSANGMPSQTLLVAPFPFALLWRLVTVDGDTYNEGWYSLLDKSGKAVSFNAHERGLALLDPVSDHPPIQRMQWFTRGLYSATWQQQDLVMTDLRIGAESGYIFSFAVASRQGEAIVPVLSRAVPAQLDADGLRLLLRRYLDASVKPIVKEAPVNR